MTAFCAIGRASIHNPWGRLDTQALWLRPALTMARRELIPLEEGELAQLIRAAPYGVPVPVAFGTGGCALIWKEARWALALLAEWRGVTFSEGAGI